MHTYVHACYTLPYFHSLLASKHWSVQIALASLSLGAWAQCFWREGRSSTVLLAAVAEAM